VNKQTSAKRKIVHVDKQCHYIGYPSAHCDIVTADLLVRRKPKWYCLKTDSKLSCSVQCVGLRGG